MVFHFFPSPLTKNLHFCASLGYYDRHQRNIFITPPPQKGQWQRKYASLAHPSIVAAINSLYDFENEQQAYARLAQFAKTFVTSTHAPHDAHSIILWIGGYEISAREKGQGFKGNFAMLSVSRTSNGKFTISASKIASELQFHPQRIRPKQTIPDWGHPILRDIKKKRIYFSLEEAVGELMRLHSQYPEISIPNPTRLFIMVYEKPAQKYKFSVHPLPDGTFIIEYKRNIKRKAPQQKIPENTKGYFSQKEKIRRAGKQSKRNASNIFSTPITQ